MYRENQFVLSASWKFAKYYEKALQKIGKEKKLTQSEMDIIIFLHVNEPINTASEIAQYRSISKSLICKSVAILLDKKLIESSHDTVDARVIRLKLTEKGKSFAKQLVAICEELNKNLFWGVTDAEMQFLSNIYNKISENGDKFYK